MAFFAILEPLLAILVIAMLLSQTLVPELLGQPWFPVLRRGWKIREDIAKAKENQADIVLLEALNKLKGDKDGRDQNKPAE